MYVLETRGRKKRSKVKKKNGQIEPIEEDNVDGTPDHT